MQISPKAAATKNKIQRNWSKKSKNANKWKDGVDSRKRQAFTHSGLKHFRLNA